MLTIAPPPRCTIPGIACLEHRNVPRALTAKTFSHTSSVVSGAFVVEPIPATLTSTSRSLIAAATWASSRTSSSSACASSSRATAWGDRSATVSSAPAAASMRATAAPIPDPPPVTSARFPSKLMPAIVSRPEHGAFRGRADERAVAAEDTARGRERRWLPRGEARLDLGVVDLEYQRLGFDVDCDRVAVPHDRERAAARCFGCDVAHHQAARRARETAVGDERDRRPEAGADHGCRDAQHLAHAPAPRRALVAGGETG